MFVTLQFINVVYISNVLLKGELTDVQVYIISSKSHTMTTHNYDKD